MMEFVSKNEKGKPQKMDLPLLKTISQVKNTLLRFWIHCRKHNSWIKDFKEKSQSASSHWL